MLKLLLVDDELFFRQGLRSIMNWELCGFEVIGEQDNGEDAYHFIVEHQPDVVITDIRMPECDGLEMIHKVVHEAQLKTKFIIVSGYDEFKYAQQAVKYGVCDFLLKPIDEENLEQTLTEIASKLHSEKEQVKYSISHQMINLFEKVVTEDHSEEQLLYYYRQLKLNVAQPYTFVCIERYEGLSEIRNDDQRTEQLKKDMSTIKMNIPELHEYHLFSYHGKICIILSHQLISPYSSMSNFLKGLHNKLQHNNQVYLMYSSQTCRGLTFLQEAYRQAEFAYQFKYYDERERFEYEYFANLALRYIMLPAEYYKAIIHEIENNNDDAIKHELDKLFLQFQNECCSIEAIRASLHKLVADCLGILQVMKIDRSGLTHLHLMLNWDAAETNLKRLKGISLLFFMECSARISEARYEMTKGGIQKIKKYIDQQYAEQMNLKSIAAQFYINPVYLGQLFKKTYGVYFNDYLLQLRIHEAKKLLRQTDLRIYEIAEKVGFNHSEYFVAQFEKLEKLSPTAYRQTFQSIVGES